MANKDVTQYNKFIDSLAQGLSLGSPYNFENKSESITYYTTTFLNRLSSMFEYKNLPETIPKRYLDTYLFLKGYTAIAKNPIDNNLYVLWGNGGGERNAYYFPKRYIGANPWLKWTFDLEIGKDCVVIANDEMYSGLLPLLSRNSTILSEIDLTFKIATINARLTNLLTAGTDATKKALENYLKDIESGKLGSILDKGLQENISAQPYGSQSPRYITQLIEAKQYWLASMFNELGINSNYNMKRESITDNEVQMNNDSLLPLVDNMLKCRQDGIEKVNEMFGTNITVDFNSVWKTNRQETDLQLKAMEVQIDGVRSNGQDEKKTEGDNDETN